MAEQRVNEVANLKFVKIYIGSQLHTYYLEVLQRLANNKLSEPSSLLTPLATCLQFIIKQTQFFLFIYYKNFHTHI